MEVTRLFHACGKIYSRSSLEDSSNVKRETSAIIVGGLTGLTDTSTFTASVEILDDSSRSWRKGPDFPVAMKSAVAICDLSGGLLVIGGTSGGFTPLATIYRLADADENTTWGKLTAKLSTPRFDHFAVVVSSKFASCENPSKSSGF